MTIRKALVGLTAAGMLASVPALASSNDSSVENELAEMRELVEGLKQRVEAQEEQIGHQAERLEAAQEAVRQQRATATAEEQSGLTSAVSEFWGGVDVGLSVAGSYAWNFDNPDLSVVGPGIGGNNGTSGLFYPFHNDHNSFQVDQVWLDIGKESTEESRAGFGFTLLYGNTAAFLGQGGNTGAVPIGTVLPGGGVDLDGDGVADTTGGVGSTVTANTSRRFINDSASDYYVHQAFVTYLAPVGEGVEVKFGKFATLIGAEVADATANWNITRGNIYNLFQPIDHVGVLASTSVGPLNFAAGVVNEIGLGASSPDLNKEKSYLGHIGYSGEMGGVGVTLAYGADGQSVTARNPGDNGSDFGLLDVVATLETDGFEAWLNADYLWAEGTRASAWGIALAGRVPLTEELSSAIRLEYAEDKTSGSSGTFPAGLFGLADPTTHSQVWGVTGTLAYALAQNLELKGEVRWDRVESDAPHEFPGNSTGSGSRDQVVALAQVVYGF